MFFGQMLNPVGSGEKAPLRDEKFVALPLFLDPAFEPREFALAVARRMLEVVNEIGRHEQAEHEHGVEEAEHGLEPLERSKGIGALARRMSGSGRSDRGPELGRAGSRVSRNLFIAGRYGLRPQKLEAWRCRLDGRLMARGARLSATALGEEAFDDAVFQRMKGHDCEPPAGLEQLLRRA